MAAVEEELPLLANSGGFRLDSRKAGCEKFNNGRIHKGAKRPEREEDDEKAD
jgi:hypothetical protein